MEIFTSADATALVTTITGFITENITAVLVVLGTIVGLKFVAKLVNGARKGKVTV